MGIIQPMRFVALLRAINVGGRNVKMDRLREIFVGLGFDDVSTYIASGNVLFSAPAAIPAADREHVIEAALRQHLGFVVPTFVLDGHALSALVGREAFDGRWGRPGSVPNGQPGSVPNGQPGSYAGPLKRDATAAERERVAALSTEIDSFEIHGRELFWLCETSMGQSKITPAKLERALGQPTTMRNANTMAALATRLQV